MKTLLTITMILLATACGQAETRTTVTKSSAGSAEEEKDKEQAIEAKARTVLSNENETVSIPNQISGALLHCAFANDPAAAVTAELAVGCRVEDKQGARVALADIAELSIYSFEAPKNSKAQVSVQPLVDNSTYDVAYFFKGSDIDASKAVALDTIIKVAFKNLKTGEKDQGISAKLSSILDKAKAFIKEVKVLGAAGYAVVSSQGRVLKDAAAEKAKQAGSKIGDVASQAEAVFKGIFGK